MRNKADVCAIVVAAGKGLRLESKVSKPLVTLNRKPLFIYCLEVLNKHPQICDIVLVTSLENKTRIIEQVAKYDIDKVLRVVLGGVRRQDSVERGLSSVSRLAQYVLIHDAARPFINAKMISTVILAARKSGSAIVGVPVKETVKKVVRVKGKGLGVKETLKRDELWVAQTPQIFRKDIIINAYKKFGKLSVTDDAALVEKLGSRVSLVNGSYDNIKITTPEDLITAQELLKKWK
ncbi:MAG: 2-C-methyl-D-erythritol 4-phosphate cytidylyltransferase [Candidatus Omnitrophica bacterium]|nr:2-C-methyl-D-erythritol 4-phosphate cytidylyltransferase [Candidatus Omnitrophota bacterium]